MQLSSRVGLDNTFNFFIVVVVEAVVWSHGRNMDSKKNRNM